MFRRRVSMPPCCCVIFLSTCWFLFCSVCSSPRLCGIPPSPSCVDAHHMAAPVLTLVLLLFSVGACELGSRFALALLSSSGISGGIECDSLPSLCDSMVALLVEAQQQHCYYVDSALTSVDDLRPTLASAVAALMAAAAPPLKNRKLFNPLALGSHERFSDDDDSSSIVCLYRSRWSCEASDA